VIAGDWKYVSVKGEGFLLLLTDDRGDRTNLAVSELGKLVEIQAIAKPEIGSVRTR
jgi:hypothetical protein